MIYVILILYVNLLLKQYVLIYNIMLVKSHVNQFKVVNFYPQEIQEDFA